MLNNGKSLRRRLRAGFLGLASAALAIFALAAPAPAETPDETYKALGLAKTATPKELYEALTKRYHDEAQGAGKG
jgi:hydroxylamine dehydrogenase